MATAETPAVEEVEKGQVPLDITESEEIVEVEAKDQVDAAPEVIEESEQEQYSKGVQKRINKLTKRVKETERERDEAVQFAQGAKAQADKATSQLQQLDQSYLSEYGGRISAEQTQAETELKRAVETGDSQATVDAQRKLTHLAVAADRYEQAKVQQEQQAAYAAQMQQQAQSNNVQQFPGAGAPPTQPQKADPKAERWATKNEWFGEDYTMTFAAFGIHKKLVEEEGFDPQTDDYYDELDKRIKNEFAHKFEDRAGKKTAQTVASVSRGSRSGRKKVRLTPSQVTIAKKLGVPLEEYAKYVKE
ncbi:hypothetical protein CMI37_20935 [Candidatus Pacearchaeota archaeon]|nr:hypothetical protein [Candidatus Pacearchaeota archaeon]|tara:strand:- start:979 stop:1890 length:912 start_codon:yes stop_codon:yes gene_type:complete